MEFASFCVCCYVVVHGLSVQVKAARAGHAIVSCFVQGMANVDLRKIAFEASIRRPNRLSRRAKLRNYRQLPDYLRDNEYILSHYRANYGIVQSLWSLFFLHNETGNIWSHLIGRILILVLV